MIKSSWFWPVLLCAIIYSLAIAGCTVGPDYQPPKVNMLWISQEDSNAGIVDGRAIWRADFFGSLSGLFDSY